MLRHHAVVAEAQQPGFAPTVTVLFADIEGSTALLERLGQARWLEVLAEYESLLRDRVGVYGGREIKALGDGHMVVFRSARAAVRCAVGLQRALPIKSAPDLRVRVGLHTGEPGAADDDLHGRTVVKAARIAALARGGEVIVSRLVRELADGDDAIGDDIWFDEEREVELRGLRGHHGVVSVHWQREAVRPLSVVIADDSAVVRDGVAAVLRESGIDVKDTARDAETLYAAIDRHRPDVAVVDIRMPPSRTNEGLVAAERLARSHPEVGVLVLSQHLELGYALQLVRDRAERRGYLLKDRVADIDSLLDAVRRVARGGCVIDQAIADRLVDQASAARPLEHLTDREREVLRLIAQGLSNRAIAEQLVVTVKTVETHVGQIFLKLNLGKESREDRRVAAVLTYLRAVSAS
jgi:DNA-binding NarL/FixJ family response regulator/class 3 adenylate cyclase